MSKKPNPMEAVALVAILAVAVIVLIAKPEPTRHAARIATVNRVYSASITLKNNSLPNPLPVSRP
jgi:hypothetical protein